MENIKVLALGGLDEEGKDLYCVEINNKIFVINCGFKYPTKLTPGIDFIIADFTYLTDNKEKIAAYILPKTKKNNFGALPYIYKECPAISIDEGNLTSLIIKSFSCLYSFANSKNASLVNFVQ